MIFSCRTSHSLLLSVSSLFLPGSLACLPSSPPPPSLLFEGRPCFHRFHELQRMHLLAARSLPSPSVTHELTHSLTGAHTKTCTFSQKLRNSPRQQLKADYLTAKVIFLVKSRFQNPFFKICSSYYQLYPNYIPNFLIHSYPIDLPSTVSTSFSPRHLGSLGIESWDSFHVFVDSPDCPKL
jgi:hypothetical protein